MATAKETLRTVAHAFSLPGEWIHATALSNGIINRTVKCVFRLPDGSTKAYIFQKINTYVFRDPDAVMANIRLVTEHIEKKAGTGHTLRFYHTADGGNFFVTPDGERWRVCDYIDGITRSCTDDPRLLPSVGYAFGQFLFWLSDLDASRLKETIPDFHNTARRYASLDESVRRDPLGRAAGAAEEIAFLSSVRERACRLSLSCSRGELPLRVTHNDTKTDNVLFDKRTEAPLAVIDLDTVMPGMAAYDFGDAVRFVCSTRREDSPDTENVALDLSKFEQLARGYLAGAGDALTDAEADTLALGAFSAAAELSVRFLDDYLSGDRYFRTEYPTHNLVRARNQIALTADMARKFDQMNEAIRRCR